MVLRLERSDTRYTARRRSEHSRTGARARPLPAGPLPFSQRPAGRRPLSRAGQAVRGGRRPTAVLARTPPEASKLRLARGGADSLSAAGLLCSASRPAAGPAGPLRFLPCPPACAKTTAPLAEKRNCGRADTTRRCAPLHTTTRAAKRNESKAPSQGACSAKTRKDHAAEPSTKRLCWEPTRTTPPSIAPCPKAHKSVAKG